MQKNINLILTTETEEQLSTILKPYIYKFLDLELIKNDFKENFDNPNSQYFDIHFNAHLTLKLQNTFKSSKCTYFIYRVPFIKDYIVKNLKTLVEEKYSKKFNKIIIVSSKIQEIYESLNDTNGIDFIEYCPTLEKI
jgi:hypothetical protein